jgi:hypothetical protein
MKTWLYLMYKIGYTVGIFYYKTQNAYLNGVKKYLNNRLDK